jgi:serine/threonine protein phosphatase PrpC
MSWQITFAQSLGAQAEQQDCGGAWPSPDGTHVLAVLADGAGGHRGGRQASETAVSIACKYWSETPPALDAMPSFLNMITRAAHDAVSELGNHSCRTTWVALIAGPNEARCVHSGDSRLYHFVRGELANRTKDHSLVQALIETGKVAPSDAAKHPDRSTLLQSLGGLKFYSPEHASAKLTGDDCFLLCTDGVWTELTEEELSSLAKMTVGGRQDRVDNLIHLAVQRASDRADNASLWCITNG